MWDWDDDGGLAPAGDVLGAPAAPPDSDYDELVNCGCEECVAELKARGWA